MANIKMCDMCLNEDKYSEADFSYKDFDLCELHYCQLLDVIINPSKCSYEGNEEWHVNLIQENNCNFAAWKT